MHPVVAGPARGRHRGQGPVGELLERVGVGRPAEIVLSVRGGLVRGGLVRRLVRGSSAASRRVEEQGVLGLLERLLDQRADRRGRRVPQLEPAVPVVTHRQLRAGTGPPLRRRSGRIVGLVRVGGAVAGRGGEGVPGDGAAQLRHRRVPGQRRHRRLVPRRHRPGHHGHLVQRQLTSVQRSRRVGQLGPPGRDPHDVRGVRRRQPGPDHQVVLRGGEPTIAPVPALDQLGRDLDQLGMRPVQPPRDLRGPRPQVPLPGIPGDGDGADRHTPIVHVFERVHHGCPQPIHCRATRFSLGTRLITPAAGRPRGRG